MSVHRESRGTYGSPRVLAELRARDEPTSRRRVARLMREREILGRFMRTWCHASAASNASTHEPKVLDRSFASDPPARAWGRDITSIKTWDGWLFLAVIDFFSPRVVGWSMRHDMHVDLMLRSLTLREHGITGSMSGRGSCDDNAVSESFFGTHESELIYRQSWPMQSEPARTFHDYIQILYNRQRRHATPGSIIPAEFERRYEHNLTRAA